MVECGTTPLKVERLSKNSVAFEVRLPTPRGKVGGDAELWTNAKVGATMRPEEGVEGGGVELGRTQSTGSR